MLKESNFSLLLLLTISMFRSSKSHQIQTPKQIELQRLQLKCSDGDPGVSADQEHLNMVQSKQISPQGNDGNDGFLQIHEDSESSEYEESCHDQRNRDRQFQRYEDLHGGGSDGVAPERRYRDCQILCNIRKKDEKERLLCLTKCKEEYAKRRGRTEGSDNRDNQGEKNSQGKNRKQEKNPYLFDTQSFDWWFRSEEAGMFRVLEVFSEGHELLKDIDRYCLVVLEANHDTLLIPHHWDAEAVVVVTDGEGIMNFVNQGNRESFSLHPGDVIKVPAGSTMYLINQNIKKLRILMLIHPINARDHIKRFVGAGGRDHESFYRVFSSEVLEAAFNAPRDRLDKLFGHRRKGIIVKANKEQIRALSHQMQQRKAGFSSVRGESRGPFNLLNQKPSISSPFGEFFEVSAQHFEQLKDMNVSVAIMNIHQGAMALPYYNTCSTRLVMVAAGRGYFEMSCPNHSRSSESRNTNSGERDKRSIQEQHYNKVRADLLPGDVFVIPSGHPVSIMSSEKETLRLVEFGINAHNNQKNFLSGKDNIWNQVESQVKELAFELSGREVDEIFRRQEQSFFAPGPRLQDPRLQS